MTSAPRRAFGPIRQPWVRMGRRADTGEVQPWAEPFDARPAEGGTRAGVLVLHGFTGSPRSMLPWAEHLVADGFRVVVPRLPGHGTTWQDLNTKGWGDWYGVAEETFDQLRGECDQVFVAALSMGSALALRLAEVHEGAVAGLALVNPFISQRDVRLLALPLLRRLTPSFPGVVNDIAKPGQDEGGYDRLPLNAMHSLVRAWPTLHAELPKVRCPVLVFQSRIDHTVDASSVPLIMESVGSADRELIRLERSYHVATLDYDAEEVFSTSSAFFRRLMKD